MASLRPYETAARAILKDRSFPKDFRNSEMPDGDSIFMYFLTVKSPKNSSAMFKSIASFPTLVPPDPKPGFMNWICWKDHLRRQGAHQGASRRG